jgi:5-methyltetrahydropteroyltriglutamate--homocysteine methyltransferase
MQTHNLGYPRIGSHRELKKASENYWAGNASAQELQQTAYELRLRHWKAQSEAGIELVPVNDFSLYDHVLDTLLTFGAIPERYQPLVGGAQPLDLYFAMARGHQRDGLDLRAMEMTKWFDTNYHYIVPEFHREQQFQLFRPKVLDELAEALQAGIKAKPVLLGPISFLLLGKAKNTDFNTLDLLPRLLPVYAQLLQRIADQGVTWVQLDEPILATDISPEAQIALVQAYNYLRKSVPGLKFLLANYFDCFGEALDTVLSLPVEALHLDLVRCPSQLDDLLEHPALGDQRILSLGVVDGRNVWRNDFAHSLTFLRKAVAKVGEARVWVAPSCSLLHSPIDLSLETKLDQELQQWLAFAQQKLEEVSTLAELASTAEPSRRALARLELNQQAHEARRRSTRIHNPEVKKRLEALKADHFRRQSAFDQRQSAQHKALKLPLFPTTTIGSFPQTPEVRALRANFKKGAISAAEYEAAMEEAIRESITWQEEVGMDVLVHGEFERNDMVEYFGELLEGFAFTQYGWVQSYGSRCVKPPIIYGDVWRSRDLSVRWSSFAQAQTQLPVKGMLTGPVTILQWSFVRDDQPRHQTAFQIACAINDEVKALEVAGIGVIQIDEPAFREGLPLRQKDRPAYLDWAVKAFRLSNSGVSDQTQIHTHMCYSEFNDIIEAIAAMDADVITIETSRSDMELLDAFVDFKYPNEIGPGVYDIHSPRIPSTDEMEALLLKALKFVPARNLWVNPDCGLKTRRWPETKEALIRMIAVAKALREKTAAPVAS